MRSFLLFPLLFIGLMASPSFYSLSHGKFLHKLHEKMVDPQTNQSFYIIDRYPITFREEKYLSTVDNVIDGKIYYSSGWDYYKAYVPAGAFVDITISTYPNTTLRMHAKFRGDKNNIFDHAQPIFTGFSKNFLKELISDQQPTVDAIIVNNGGMTFNNLPTGGWVYFSLTGDVSGYYENFPGGTQIELVYNIEIVDKQKFYQDLKTIKYNAPDGDPIDAVDYLVVKNPVGPNDIVEYNMSLNRPDHTYEFNESYLLDMSSDDISGEITHSSSSSSLSSSKSSCTDPVYKELGLCEDESSVLEAKQYSSSSSLSSIANSGSTISNEEKELAEFLNGKSKSIKGYYIHYGEGKFQWIYVTAGNKTPYKLEGWDEENKRIIWKNLSSCLEANVEGKNIIFHKKSSCENSEEAQLSSINQSESSSSQSSIQSSSEASTYTEESYSNQSSSVSSIQGFQGEQGTLPVPRNN